MRSLSSVWGIVVAVVLAGCGGDVLAGGAKDIEMYAVANGGPGGYGAEGAGPGHTSLAAGAGAHAARFDLVGLTGTVEFDVTATLIDEQGVNVVLASNTRVPVRLEAADSARFAARRAPLAEYPILRLSFSRITASVETGLIVGGIPRPGPLRVDIPAGGLIVDVPVELNVPARPREMLVVDLNAREWMPALNVQTGVVPAGAFRSAVRVRVR